MDRRALEILSKFDEEDQRLLRTYINIIFEYKNQEEMQEALKEKMQETALRLRKVEQKAIKKLEKEKANPKCSFCRKSSNEVEKLFTKTEYLNICSECVRVCYSQLGTK